MQEAKGKWPALRAETPGIALHLIGPLQFNKAREAVELFDAIHSIDREKIARAVAAEMKAQGKHLQLFVQVNTTRGIDIVAKAHAAVKACLSGSVTLASWTTDAGHVLQIQHANDLVSVYKHNSVLLKGVGDKVKAGAAIAIVGNSGELTTGPHLHFELWLSGEPVDPQAYMVFE